MRTERRYRLQGLPMAAVPFVLFLAVNCFSQTATKLGSIAGVVTGANGMPLREASVTLIEMTASPGPSQPGRFNEVTDDMGRYRFSALPEGTFKLTGQGKRSETVMEKDRDGRSGRSYAAGATASRLVTLRRGAELAGVDLRIEGETTISGIVLDDERRPAKGMAVSLIANLYEFGRLRRYIVESEVTDEHGKYVLRYALPGMSVQIVARNRELTLNDPTATAAGGAPSAVLAPTYYPGAPSIDSATVLVIREGEQFQHIDIQMRRVDAYCIEGELLAAGKPAKSRYLLSASDPSYGGGSSGPIPHGVTADDGAFRACGLPRGQYVLTALGTFSRQQPGPEILGGLVGVSLSAKREVVVVDHDVQITALSAEAPGSLHCEVLWEGKTPPQGSGLSVQVTLEPVSGPGSVVAQSPIPGRCELSSVPGGEYSVTVSGIPAGSYIQDVVFNGASLLGSSLRLQDGSRASPLQIRLSPDGAAASAVVTDERGDALPEAYVYLWPAKASSSVEIAGALISGKTDAAGQFLSPATAPGEYYILATPVKLFRTPETLRALAGLAPRKAMKVDLAPRAIASVRLQLVAVE
jgi:hypothetical protein